MNKILGAALALSLATALSATPQAPATGGDPASQPPAKHGGKQHKGKHARKAKEHHPPSKP